MIYMEKIEKLKELLNVLDRGNINNKYKEGLDFFWTLLQLIDFRFEDKNYKITNDLSLHYSRQIFKEYENSDFGKQQAIATILITQIQEMIRSAYENEMCFDLDYDADNDDANYWMSVAYYTAVYTIDKITSTTPVVFSLLKEKLLSVLNKEEIIIYIKK